MTKRPSKDNGDGTATVYLTKGYTATIDAGDIDRVDQHSWCASLHNQKSKYGRPLVYAISKVGGIMALLHAYISGTPKGFMVDHMNMNTLDNRRLNLRVCTRSQNAANRGKDRLQKGTSPYKGVSFWKRTKKWRACIVVAGQSIHLGLYCDELTAARAYDKGAIHYFGEFARGNFV